MKIKNCKRCGKVYTYNGIDLCPDCYKKEENDFLKIRDYIETNPLATIIEVSTKTGIKLQKIMDFLKEGRLILNAENKNMVLNCERCGKPILTGRYCETCSIEIEKVLKEGLIKNEESNSANQDKLYLKHRIEKFK